MENECLMKYLGQVFKEKISPCLCVCVCECLQISLTSAWREIKSRLFFCFHNLGANMQKKEKRIWPVEERDEIVN